jgi:hypothetical protein
MFSRGKDKYFPLEDIALSGMGQRAQSLPTYAKDAMTFAKSVAEPMNLSY